MYVTYVGRIGRFERQVRGCRVATEVERRRREECGFRQQNSVIRRGLRPDLTRLRDCVAEARPLTRISVRFVKPIEQLSHERYEVVVCPGPQITKLKRCLCEAETLDVVKGVCVANPLRERRPHVIPQESATVARTTSNTAS